MCKNKFIQSSHIEREKMLLAFKLMDVEDYKFTPPNGFERHDGEFTRDISKYIFEVKVRNIYSYEYLETVIEASKTEYLLNKSKVMSCNPLVFIFFKDDKCLIQNLTFKDFETKTMKAPRTTAGNNEKIDKLFTLIPIDKTNTFTL